jgi:hypothetical protein
MLNLKTPLFKGVGGIQVNLLLYNMLNLKALLFKGVGGDPNLLTTLVSLNLLLHNYKFLSRLT